MRYSDAMTITHVAAPDIPNPAYPNGGYPTRGKRLGPAWAAAWREIETASARGRWLDGKVLAERVAADKDLAEVTIVAVLGRAASAGLLAKTGREVVTTRGKRTRMFYALPGTPEPEDV